MGKKRNIYILYAMALLQGMVFYGPIATLYRRAAGVGLGQIALMESVSLVLAVLLELPWGILAERLGYKRTMVFCSGLFFVTKVIFWRATGFGGFLLERILLGVVDAGLSGIDTGILYLSCPDEEAHRVFGIYNNMTILGLLAATGVYTVLIGENYRLAGLLTAVSYAAAAVLSLGLEEVRFPARHRGRAALTEFGKMLRETLGQGRLLLFLTGAALFGAVQQMVTVFYSQPQYQRTGMSAAGMGVAYAFMTISGLLGGFSARLAEKIGRKRTLFLLPMVSALACFILALTKNGLLSVLAVSLFRAAFNLYQPMQATVQNRAIMSEDRATALSVHAVLLDGITIPATLFLGRLSEQSLSAAFLLGGALCLGSLGLLGWAGRAMALEKAGKSGNGGNA